MMMDVAVGALDLEMKPPECYQEEVLDLKRLRSDESVVDGEKLINKTPQLLGDVVDDDDGDDGSNPNPKPDDCDDDDDEEEKLRLKQKEKDAIAAAKFADFCQYIDEHTTVYTHDTYPDHTVDIKQRELEALEVFQKIQNGTRSDYVGYCPVCKKEKYNCDHYHYNKRWKSYSLKSCFICNTQGQHFALDCPDFSKYDKRIHPIWGGRYY